jgi:hypothetical protein
MARADQPLNRKPMIKKILNYSFQRTGLNLAALTGMALISFTTAHAQVTGFGSTSETVNSSDPSVSNGTFTINAGDCCSGQQAAISGSAVPAASTLTLGGGGSYNYGSGFANTAQAYSSFTSSFTFQQAPITGSALAFAFVLQNDSRGVNALDTDNGGYAGNGAAIENSFQVVFLPGSDSVGFLVNGTSDAVPAFSVTSPTATGINFLDLVSASVSYTGTTLSLTLAGTSDTADPISGLFDPATYTTTDTVDLSTVLNGLAATVGFSSNQNDAGVTFSDFSYVEAPEPSVGSLGLMGALLLGGVYLRKRKLA